MKRSEIEIDGVYANKRGDRFRVVTGVGHYPLYEGQADLGGIQYLSIVRRKRGLVFAPGNYTSKGKRSMGGRAGLYGHITVTSFASWAGQKISEKDAVEIRMIIAEGLLSVSGPVKTKDSS